MPLFRQRYTRYYDDICCHDAFDADDYALIRHRYDFSPPLSLLCYARAELR